MLTTKDGTLIQFKGQPVVFSHRWSLTADACVADGTPTTELSDERSLSGVASVPICARWITAERQGITMRAL